jgi:hypothetical protein
VRSSDAIFLAIAIPLIFLFTAWRIWVFRKGTRLLRQLLQLVDEAKKREDAVPDPPRD